MENHDNVSRRNFIQRISMIGIAGVGGSAILSACGSGDESGSQQSGSQQSGSESAATAEGSTSEASFACDDLSGLNEQEMNQREQMTSSLNYVAESPNSEKLCSNCALYVQPGEGEQCGGCTLFPGPVHPNGYCTSWAPAS